MIFIQNAVLVALAFQIRGLSVQDRIYYDDIQVCLLTSKIVHNEAIVKSTS